LVGAFVREVGEASVGGEGGQGSIHSVDRGGSTGSKISTRKGPAFAASGVGG